MSALRIARRGYPTELIDQGPACGRVLHTRGPVAPLGGMLVVAHVPPPAPVTEDQRARWREQSRSYNRRHHDELMEKQRQKRAAAREAARPRCGRWIILARAECGRTQQHAGSCTTAETLAGRAERRRAS